MQEGDQEGQFESGKYTSDKKDVQELQGTIYERRIHVHSNYTSSKKEKQQSSNISQIITLNAQLRFIGINGFSYYHQCSNKHLQQLAQIINLLLMQRNREKDRSKSAENSYHKAQFEINRLIRDVDSLTDQLNNLRAAKQELIERIKVIQRENKSKLDIFLKQREKLQKQKKAYEGREQSIKNQFKKKDDKIFVLESKIRNWQQKNNKIQYKIVFESDPNLIKKEENSLIERQCDALVVKAIKQKEIYLQRENNLMRQFIKSHFQTLYRIVECNPEQIQDRVSFNRYLQLLQYPFEQANSFIDKMRAMTDKINQMIYQNLDTPRNAGKPNQSNLTYALEKMKYYYTNARILEEKRSQIGAHIFKILNKKEKLTKNALEEIENAINNQSNSQTALNSPEKEQIDNIKQQEQYFAENDRKTSQNIKFIREQIEFMSRRANFINSLQQKLSQSMVERDDQSLL